MSVEKWVEVWEKMCGSEKKVWKEMFGGGTSMSVGGVKRVRGGEGKCWRRYGKVWGEI